MALRSTSPNPPLCLPGFEHIRRRWDDVYQAFTARILPGEFYVTNQEEGISTTLGSCISACIRDKRSGLGGMNHFMLPSDEKGSTLASSLSAATRYGNHAMEHLINTILRNGGRRENLEVKLFGGGRIIANMTDVGRRNIAFVLDYLATENLEAVAADVGNTFPRMVIYFPTTGKVRVKRLRSLHNNTIAAEETRYIESINKQPISGDVELF